MRHIEGDAIAPGPRGRDRAGTKWDAIAPGPMDAIAPTKGGYPRKEISEQPQA